jgi:hypothetical protein
MSEARQFPSEIQFFFELDRDYRSIACNGAWGGITPRGDIHVDFFIEKQGVPESVTQRVAEDGTLGAISEMKPEKRIVRRLQVGILMTAEEAKNLVKFLSDKIEQLEKVKVRADG